MSNSEILQKLMIFHETNDISQNSSGMIHLSDSSDLAYCASDKLMTPLKYYNI